jgi:DNA-binding response OmpR family regulator
VQSRSVDFKPEHSVTFAQSVLVVEDDAGLRRLLVDVIAADPDFSAEGAGSIAEADALLARPGSRFDAILLDLGLPDGDGGEFCRQLRQRGIACPIILLTGCVAKGDFGRGMESGASDYLAKPVSVAELMRRLREQMVAARAGLASTG